MDLRASFAFPFPVTVIAALLGVPAADQAQFALWSHGFETLLDGVPLTDDELVDAFEQVAAMMEYLRGAVARHRLDPADDLLQALITAQDEGAVLTEDEALMNAVALLAAGHITTTNLLGNGLLALLRHPTQMQRLRRDPALLPYAVEELLRYDGPVQAMGRVAREDLEIGGRQIAAGDRVLVVMGAANHDPARFPDPDILDITRESGQHLTFGHGPHYCLGAPLARLEAEIAFDALLQLEDLRLDCDEPVWKQTTVFRGLEALPIAFRPQ
jgi:cytochrome P450